jgi:hypothetical protein
MKRTAVIVFGRLPEEKYNTNLGMAENIREIREIKDEYREVFPNMLFHIVVATDKEYLEAKAKAFATLLGNLYGPITNLFINTMQITRR